MAPSTAGAQYANERGAASRPPPPRAQAAKLSSMASHTTRAGTPVPCHPRTLYESVAESIKPDPLSTKKVCSTKR